jgi:hypothetical protein
MFKELIVHRAGLCRSIYAGRDSVGPDCAGLDRTCTLAPGSCRGVLKIVAASLPVYLGFLRGVLWVVEPAAPLDKSNQLVGAQLLGSSNQPEVQ